MPDRSTHFALTVNWWDRWKDRPPVQSAVTTTLLAHLSLIVSEALDGNKDRGRIPATWKDLAELCGLDYTKLFRRRNGQHKTTVLEFQSMARVLQLPPGDLLPDDAGYIARSALALAGGQASPEEADAYARYCLALPMSHFSAPPLDEGLLDPAAVDRALRGQTRFRNPDEFGRAVRKVAAAIEPALRRAGQGRFSRS